MRKLKLALLLPLGQFLVSLSIMRWHILNIYHLSDALWFAINAPTLPVLDILLRLAPLRLAPRIMGVLSRDSIVLAMSIVVWYFVGRYLDSLRLSKRQPLKPPTTGNILLNLLLVCYGVRLVFVSLQYLLPAYPSQPLRPGDLVGGTISLAWALGLIALPGIRLSALFRAKPSNLPSPTAL